MTGLHQVDLEANETLDEVRYMIADAVDCKRFMVDLHSRAGSTDRTPLFLVPQV